MAAALSGFLAVALGAFGAHALRSTMDARMQSVYATASQYHFFHTFALALVGLTHRKDQERATIRSGSLFLSGMTIFSGSLYWLAISGWTTLGMITPLGGLLLLAGWLSLVWSGWKSS